MRKLAWVCCGFSVAAFLAHYAVPSSLLPAFGIVLFAMGIAALTLKKPLGARLPLLLLSGALGFGCCFVQYIKTIAPADLLPGQTLTVSARVTDFPTEYDGCTAVDIRLVGNNTPEADGVIYDYNGYLPKLEPGDLIELPVKFSSASAKYGEKTDMYFSRNIFARGYADGACRVTGRWAGTALYFPQYAAQAIKNAVTEAFPQDVSPFVKALLMGDKTELYAQGDSYVALRSSGLIHVVAVSGLHVAFLVGFLQLIMGRNRRSSLICLALTWLFVVMTGGTPSTVRAGFMQSMLLIAPLVRRENDGPTTLSFALAVILLISPAEAGSAALQLSFGAMAGIMAVSPAIYDYLMEKTQGKKLSRLAGYAAGVFSSSMGAVVFTTPILAIRFGYVPLLGPVTNLLCLWAVTLCFCGGFISCALWAVFHPFGVMLGWCTAWLARYIGLVTGFIAKIPFADVYTGNGFVGLWLLLTYVIFALFWFGRSGKKFRWLPPALMSAICLCTVLIASTVSSATGSGYITAVDVGQGQSLTAFAGGSTVVIDCGATGTSYNAGDTTASYLLGRGRTKVDALVLTHLHSDHANGAVRLMQMMPVSTLIMPENPNDDDGELAKILAQAAKGGTQVQYVSSDSRLTAGNIAVSLFAPPDKGTENERCLSMKLSIDGYDMLVTGDMSRTAEKALLADHDLSATELIIAGHHGSKYATSAELLAATGAITAIISVGYNSYGHPSNSALGRLMKAGAQVYRTDLNGNVTVRIP